MQKTIELQVDRSSWIGTGRQVPATFGKEDSTSVDFLSSMLQVGLLTIPWQGSACSLAVYWAHIRYCAAIDFASADLRLSTAWKEIDTHQKTILSDDWGMGVTVHWLRSRLSFRSGCDGRYFIDRLSGLGLATSAGDIQTRGVYKCPDFIFIDAWGKFHIVECKGTQNSRSSLAGQLKKGVQQKESIIFSDDKHLGQRLVAGLYIAQSDSDEASSLRIVDPDPPDDPLFRVQINDDTDPLTIRDAVLRGDLGRLFISVGLAELANAVLDLRSPRYTTTQTALKQIEATLDATVSDAEDGDWLTRAVNVDIQDYTLARLPFRAVRASQSVRKQFVRRFLVGYNPDGATLDEQFPDAKGFVLDWSSSEKAHSAQLTRGEHFRSEIQLLL